MSEPKLLRIVKAVAGRLSSIDGTGQYYTKVGNSVVRCNSTRQFSESELPACVCYLTPRTVGAESFEEQKINSQIVIEAHHTIGAHAEDTAVEMLADIQRAVETDDITLGCLVLKRLSFAGDAIFYPEDAGNYVTVQVLYDVNHIRCYGDPDT